jgi:hypothetical protein
MLVKYPQVAEKQHVFLQAFQFQAKPIRDIGYGQDGEIRLSGFGTNTGEFGDLDFKVGVASRVLEFPGFDGRSLQIRNVDKAAFIGVPGHKSASG